MSTETDRAQSRRLPYYNADARLDIARAILIAQNRRELSADEAFAVLWAIVVNRGAGSRADGDPLELARAADLVAKTLKAPHKGHHSSFGLHEHGGDPQVLAAWDFILKRLPSIPLGDLWPASSPCPEEGERP